MTDRPDLDINRRCSLSGVSGALELNSQLNFSIIAKCLESKQLSGYFLTKQPCLLYSVVRVDVLMLRLASNIGNS